MPGKLHIRGCFLKKSFVAGIRSAQTPFPARKKTSDPVLQDVRGQLQHAKSSITRGFDLVVHQIL